MTTPMDCNNDSRFDSAMSLPLPPNNQLSPHTTNVDAQHISVTSNDAYSAPWSRMNTRLGHDQAPVWHSEWPAPAYAFDHLASHATQGYRPQGLEESLATIESKLCLPTYDTTTPTSCSSPPSPPLPLPWAAAASNTTAPSTVSTNLYIDNTTICCGQCGVRFTGVYRRGNLARHVRQKHTDAKGGPYTCAADGCYRVFARQDARLKHARKYHPGLYSEPVQRRQGHERASTTSPSAKEGQASTHDYRPPASTQNHEKHLAMSTVSGAYTALPPSLNPHGAQSSQPISQLIIGSEPGFSIKEPSEACTAMSSLDFNIGQWLPTSPQTSVYKGSSIHEARQELQREVNSSIEIEELPRAARIVFTSLYAELDIDTYSQLCDGAFKRWEGFIQHLHDKRSDAYVVYAKVLEDLYAVIHAVDAGTIDSVNYECTERSPISRPPNTHEGRSCRHGSLSLGLGATSVPPVSKGSETSGRGASRLNGSGKNVKVTGKKPKKAESRQVDCPEHKHYIMHRTSHPPSCGGCSEVVMSQVRSHLNRVDHRDFASGVRQCSTCKQDFIDQSVYEMHKAVNTCRHQAQARGDIELPWARLYLTRYPATTRIPIPYCDEYGWLPDSVLAQCRSSPANPTSSFLGGPYPGPSSPLGHMPAHITPVDGASYNACLNFMLQDVVAPRSYRSGNAHAAVLARCIPGLSPSDPPMPTQGPASRDVDRYLSALHGATTEYFRLLAAAPQYLTEEQFRQTANEAEVVVQSIRNYQYRQSQIATPSHRSPDHQQQPLTPNVTPTYATPMRNLPSPPASNEHYLAAGMSTQPSSQGFDTTSSQYRMSTQTGPSSVYDPTNQTLLSPFATPSDYRRTSVSSQVVPDGPHHYRASSITRSLHDDFVQADNQANVPFTTIDPSLLTTPRSDSDSDQEIDYLRRGFFPNWN